MSEHDAADDDEPLYLDDNGVPMLFDVVIPGDYLREAGFVMAPQQPAAAPEPAPTAPAPTAEEIEARIQSAIAAALPAATERAAAAIRESLLSEVHHALSDKPDREGGS